MSRKNYRYKKEQDIWVDLMKLAIILIVIFGLSNKKPISSLIPAIITVFIVIVISIIAFAIFKTIIKNKKNSIKLNNPKLNSIKLNNFSEEIETQEKTIESKKYISKELMTNVEKIFFDTLTEIVGGNYIIQPQVNLATIIKKESKITYQNELYRNVDFGIFTKSNYELLLLIELNDKTHTDYHRRQRDKKVIEICENANIPLMAFWLNMPNTKEYISNRIAPFLKSNL